MIKYAIDHVKDALTAGLTAPDGSPCIADAGDIVTGFPHPDFIKANLPTVGSPLVALGLTCNVKGVGNREWLNREDVTVATVTYRRDVYSMAQLIIACEIHIFASGPTELLGSTADDWDGYIKQVLDIVRDNGDLIEPSGTHIVWDIVEGLSWEVPGAVPIKDQTRLPLAMIRTELTGRLLGAVSDGAPIEYLVPDEYGEIVESI